MRLDYDRQALAELSGLSYGWVQDGPNRGMEVVCICSCGGTRRIVDADTLADAPYDFEDEVERQVWTEHERDIQPCPHRAKWAAYREQGGYQILGLVNALTGHPEPAS